jgi:hypothetical protein
LVATRRQSEGSISPYAGTRAGDQDFFGQENSPWCLAMTLCVKLQRPAPQ